MGLVYLPTWHGWFCVINVGNYSKVTFCKRVITPETNSHWNAPENRPKWALKEMNHLPTIFRGLLGGSSQDSQVVRITPMYIPQRKSDRLPLPSIFSSKLAVSFREGLNLNLLLDSGKVFWGKGRYHRQECRSLLKKKTKNSGNRSKVYKPRTQMTSIFKGQPSKTRPFPIKTRVIWVLGILYHYSVIGFLRGGIPRVSVRHRTKRSNGWTYQSKHQVEIHILICPNLP